MLRNRLTGSLSPIGEQVLHCTDEVTSSSSAQSFLYVLSRSHDPSNSTNQEFATATKIRNFSSLRNQKLHKIAPIVATCAGFFRLGIVQPLLGRVEGTNTFTENPLWTTSQAVLSVHIARTRERGPPEYFQGYWPVRRKWSHSLPELVLQSSRRLKSSVLPQVSV